MNENIYQTITQESDIDELAKKEPTFFLFKHSSICPSSAQAEKNVQKFIANNPKLNDIEFGKKVYLILVIEQRGISNYIARHFDVTHQSPQILLIKDGRCVWNASHLAINEDEMVSKLQKALT